MDEPEGASDDELSGVTLAQAIKNHGIAPCGEPECLIEAAQAFVAAAKHSEEPWGEVLQLHVHTSMLRMRDRQRDHEQGATRTWYSILLFHVVQRLGGIVFTPTIKTMSDAPGSLNVENYGPDGLVLTIVPPPKTSRKVLH